MLEMIQSMVVTVWTRFSGTMAMIPYLGMLAMIHSMESLVLIPFQGETVMISRLGAIIMMCCLAVRDPTLSLERIAMTIFLAMKGMTSLTEVAETIS